MSQPFNSEEVTRLLRGRRSMFLQQFSGEVVPREKVELMLENAHWAPNHGRTEPWFFKVYTGAALDAFGEMHAKLYRANTPEDKFKQDAWDKMRTNPGKCSHMIAICLRRGDKPNIPEWEEVAAVASAVHNLHLTATALGLAGYWGSGGMTDKPALRDALGLREQDRVLGFFYLGVPKPDAVAPAMRLADWKDKVEWFE